MPRKSKKSYRKFDPVEDTLNYQFSFNDNETSALHQGINNNTAINIDDLRRIALWKINRVLDLSDETITKLRYLASLEKVTVEDEFVKELLDNLVESQGIGFPMASAILKFIKPNIFPIIDVRAYRALTGTKPYSSTYTYEKYVSYTKQLKAISESRNMSLREIDEQLYCFDKQHNGKI